MWTEQNEIDLKEYAEVLRKLSEKDFQWDAVPGKFKKIVNLEVPLGELANPKNSAQWAFGIMMNNGKGTVARLTGKERLNAHGLEGKMVFRVQYRDALMRGSCCDVDRVNIVKAK